MPKTYTYWKRELPGATLWLRLQKEPHYQDERGHHLRLGYLVTDDLANRKLPAFRFEAVELTPAQWEEWDGAELIDATTWDQLVIERLGIICRAAGMRNTASPMSTAELVEELIERDPRYIRHRYLRSRV